jgi:hypothetical protein
MIYSVIIASRTVAEMTMMMKSMKSMKMVKMVRAWKRVVKIKWLPGVGVEVFL